MERDGKKANHYYELAAVRGNAVARFNLGDGEARTGNWVRGLKHWMISAGDGYNDSVKNIQQLYMDGDATKEDYSKALQTYQAYIDEIKSDQRDKAAAFSVPMITNIIRNARSGRGRCERFIWVGLGIN